MSPKPTCAICGADRFADVWETPVCHEHFNVWSDASPFPAQIEKEAPDHSFEETAHGRQLRADALGKYYRWWTKRWVVELRAKEAA